MNVWMWCAWIFVVALVSFVAGSVSRGYRDARRSELDKAILAALAGRERTALEICAAIGRPSGTIHPNLARLERLGQITYRVEYGRYLYSLLPVVPRG